jgi:phospholipid transport system substrate-binding protein
MKTKHPIVRFGVVLLVVGIAALAQAGEPTRQIKQTTDKIIAIVSNPALKGPAKVAERRTAMNKVVDERFDWEEMSRRSLATHWAKRSPEEKKEFVELFKELLRRSYMEKVEDYSGERVRYEGETLDGNYASVKVKVITTTEKEIPLEYRLWQKGTDWLVYDFSVEGVSLVNNYRSQFNSILLKSPYKELVQKLKAKVAQ